MDPVDVWINYPHIPLAGPIKFYYLTQNAFYIHQILVLNAEARRKDHWQMMTHHVITVVLMLGSYFYNFTRVGVLIMMLMDLCDIFLPVRTLFEPILIHAHTTASRSARQNVALPGLQYDVRHYFCPIHGLLARNAPFPLFVCNQVLVV